MNRKHRRRGGEPRALVGEYRAAGRPVLLVWSTGKGFFHEARPGLDRLRPADREAAADWLRAWLSGLSHDEVYEMLFGR